tara:strand:+ start:12053 stop:12319 length:267 start_codon:yes stop_codon:yes gene_type:complete
MMVKLSKQTIMSEELFYDYYCSSCEANYTSNEVEDTCFYCNKQTLTIQVQRPKVVRARKITSEERLKQAHDNLAEPDFEWMNDVDLKR